MNYKSILVAGLLATAAATSDAVAQSDNAVPGEAGAPYAQMNHIAPIGMRTGKYFDVPESAKGPAVDPAKGYRIEQLGDGLYMVTDNTNQSMFMVYGKGVVVIDVPQSYAAHLKQAIGEVTDKPITH